MSCSKVDHSILSQYMNVRGDVLPPAAPPLPPPSPPPPELPFRGFRVKSLDSRPAFSLLEVLARSDFVAASTSVLGSICDRGNIPDLPFEFVPHQHQ